MDKCLECQQGYDLFEGECIVYAFKAIYSAADYSNKKIKLFNEDKISILYAMKIDHNISLPKSEYNFNNNESCTVYYYLTETNSTSLSYFFKNIKGLIDFSVNDFNIDDYIITNISGMFSGCSRLQHVNFIPFTGKGTKLG